MALHHRRARPASPLSPVRHAGRKTESDQCDGHLLSHKRAREATVIEVNSSGGGWSGCPQGPQALGSRESIPPVDLWTAWSSLSDMRTWGFPRSSGFDDGVEDQQQTAHGRDHRHLVQLAPGDEMVIVRAQMRVPDDGGGGRAVEHPPQRSATALDRPPAAQGFAVMVDRATPTRAAASARLRVPNSGSQANHEARSTGPTPGTLSSSSSLWRHSSEPRTAPSMSRSRCLSRLRR